MIFVATNHMQFVLIQALFKKHIFVKINCRNFSKNEHTVYFAQQVSFDSDFSARKKLPFCISRKIAGNDSLDASAFAVKLFIKSLVDLCERKPRRNNDWNPGRVFLCAFCYCAKLSECSVCCLSGGIVCRSCGHAVLS